MINGDLNEFLDKLSYGDEIIFTWNGRKFFIQGFLEHGTSGNCILYLDQWEPPIEDYYWVCKGGDKGYPVEEFLAAPIWDGKTFLKIENEVEWVDE